MLQCHQ